MAGKILFWIVATGMVLWLVVPVCWAIFGYFSQQIREARQHGEPIHTVFTGAAEGCFRFAVKSALLLGLLVIVTQVYSCMSPPRYQPEYEGWRR
jgi:hypothetical protein